MAGASNGTTNFLDGDSVTFTNTGAAAVSLNSQTRTATRVVFAAGSSGKYITTGVLRIGSGGIQFYDGNPGTPVRCSVELTADSDFTRWATAGSMNLSGAIDTKGYVATFRNQVGYRFYIDGALRGAGAVLCTRHNPINSQTWITGQSDFTGYFRNAYETLLTGSGAFKAAGDIRLTEGYGFTVGDDGAMADDESATFGRLTNSATIRMFGAAFHLRGGVATTERIATLHLAEGLDSVMANEGYAAPRGPCAWPDSSATPPVAASFRRPRPTTIWAV